VRVSLIMIAGVFGLSALVGAAAARAQSFPPDSEWMPLPCRNGPMTDRYRDEPGAIDERDIVGNDGAPAGLRAADANFFYLRLRLDADPAPGGTLRTFAWGIELDTNGNLSTYEVLLIARGADDDIALHRNTTTTLPNDPNDPANDPPVATYAFASNGRSVVASGTDFGGNTDYFLDLAVPWTDLQSVGVTRTTPVVAWAATSSTTTSLAADLACFDNATGEPTLTGTAPDPTVLDPDVDTDDDGFTDADEVEAGTDPNDPTDFPTTAGAVYEGGGGCVAAAGEGAPGQWMVIAGLVLGLCSRRRRRPTSSLRPRL